MTAPASQAEARIVALEDAVNDIRDAVKDIRQATVTIARLEERHAETREAINRCFQSAEKNAEAILAVKANCESAYKQIAHDAARESVALRTEVAEINLKLTVIEGRMKPLEEMRGFVVKAVVAVVGLVGAALIGLVLVK